MFAYRWDDNDSEPESPEAIAWSAAACHDGGSGALTGLFFSDEIPDIEMAKSICRTCTLMTPCLAGALARREPAGVWGGQLFADGQVIARKRKRGRPPKASLTMSGEQSLTIDASQALCLAEYGPGSRRSA